LEGFSAARLVQAKLAPAARISGKLFLAEFANSGVAIRIEQ
jgi:hypothetical protein